jgi:hypothetical protein
MPKLWSAVTGHRFYRLADLSARPSRVQRLEGCAQLNSFAGDKSPADSGDGSPHSKVQASQRAFASFR